MDHIFQYFRTKYGIRSRVTAGKLNKAGCHIMKPSWTRHWLEYEPNPEAAVHEFAHLWLAPKRKDLPSIQKDMDAQFGYVISEYGFMKQKRSLFEILPMGVEQVLRRRLGLPPSKKAVKEARTCVETGESCGPVVNNMQLIRVAQNLDKGARRRIRDIDLGLLVWSIEGWIEGQSIDARINRRALAKGAKL